MSAMSVKNGVHSVAWVHSLPVCREVVMTWSLGVGWTAVVTVCRYAWSAAVLWGLLASAMMYKGTEELAFRESQAVYPHRMWQGSGGWGIFMDNVRSL